MISFTAEEMGDILNTARIGLWRMEIEDNIVKRLFTDSRMDKIMGISSDASPEEKVDFLMKNIAPDDRALFEEYVGKLLEMEQAEIVYKYFHPYDGVIYIRCGGKRSRLVGNKLIVQGFHQNITESVLVEKAYEKRNTQMLAALSSDYESVYIIDLDQNTIETLRSCISQIVMEQNGKPYWDTAKILVQKVVLEEDQAEFLNFLKPDTLKEKLEVEKEFSYRYQRKRIIGGSHVYEAHFVKLGKKKESHLAAVGIRCIDKIIAREREHTQYSEALLNDCLYFYEFDVTDGYIRKEFHITDEYDPFYDLDIKLPIYYDYFNIYRGKELGMKAYTPKEDRCWTCEGLREAYKKGKRSVEIRYDSEQMPGEWTATIILTEDPVDNHLHAVYICKDVTEFRELEKRRQNELEMALQKAQNASNAKSNFLSRMSHDIRTPLNGIIGLMEIGEKHKDDYELINANRKKAMIAANHLLSLINDVLDMSKLEDGNTKLAREPFDFYDVCSEAVAICEIRARENGIQLIYDDAAESKCRHLYGSPLHVRQILLNILNNSVKYNKPGGYIKFSSKLLSYDDETAVYRITIEDSGIGMSKEYLKHLYEPFTQERCDARSRYQGTGMGMTIVKALVDKMNGSIDVYSRVGVGTKFDITIPFEIDTNPQEIEDVAKPEANDITDMNILVAEDNELNMEIIEYLLTDGGAKVTKASNGLEAYKEFLEKPAGSFDVILMDIMMPELDGYEATKRIRSSDKPDAATVPIIAMTANAFAEDVEQAKKAGMNVHLAKPIDVKKMIATISKFKR